jgi:hypothetical protein
MDQVSTLLQNAADQGFFSWKEFYTDPLSPTDLPTQCLTINLESQSRTVCEYYKGAPEAFHELYDLLAAGAGTAGQDFIPQKGYLVVYPLKGDNQAIEQDKTPVWDSAEMGVSLANSVNGAWIEGATLKAAWEIINKDMYVFIRENEALYQISLQIPGISMNEPPAP